MLMILPIGQRPPRGNDSVSGLCDRPLVDDDGVEGEIERHLSTVPVLAKTQSKRLRVLGVDPTSQDFGSELQLSPSLGYQSREE